MAVGGVAASARPTLPSPCQSLVWRDSLMRALMRPRYLVIIVTAPLSALPPCTFVASHVVAALLSCNAHVVLDGTGACARCCFFALLLLGEAQQSSAYAARRAACEKGVCSSR